MFKIEIKKNNIVTNAAQFSTEAEAIEWKTNVELTNGFGLPERPELDEQGQETGVILPAEYTVEIADVTAEIEAQNERAEALAYLAATDWYIVREWDNGVECPAEIKAAREAARLKI